MTDAHSKKLTQSAKGKTCIRCGAPDAYACHYNGPRQHAYGKGRSIKGHDLASAEFCHSCDQQFSEGVMPNDCINKWDKSEMFLHLIMLTNIRRWENGDITG